MLRSTACATACATALVLSACDVGSDSNGEEGAGAASPSERTTTAPRSGSGGERPAQDGKGGRDGKGGKDSGQGGSQPSGNVGSQAEFCTSADGKRLRVVNKEVQKAYAARKGRELLDLTNRTLELTAGAPRGASCAVIMLGSLRLYWTSGQIERSAGVNPRAQAKRVREFQRSHELSEPVYR